MSAVLEQIPQRRQQKSDLLLSKAQQPKTLPQNTIQLQQLQLFQSQLQSQHQLIQRKQHELLESQQLQQSLQQENEKLSAKVEQLKRDLVLQQSTIVESQAAFESLQKEQLEDFQQQFDALKQKNTQYKMKIKEYELLTAQVQEKLINAQSDVEHAQAKISQQKLQHRAKIDQLEEKIHQLERKNEALNDVVLKEKQNVNEREIALQNAQLAARQQQAAAVSELEGQIVRLQTQLKAEQQQFSDDLDAKQAIYKQQTTQLKDQHMQQIQSINLKNQELEQINLSLKANLRQTLVNNQEEQQRLKIMLDQKAHELELAQMSVQQELRKKQQQLESSQQNLDFQYSVKQNEVEKQFQSVVQQYNMRIQNIQSSCDVQVAEVKRELLKAQQEVQIQKQENQKLGNQLAQQSDKFNAEKSIITERNQQLLLTNQQLVSQQRNGTANELRKIQLELQFIQSDLLQAKNVIKNVQLPSQSLIYNIVMLSLPKTQADTTQVKEHLEVNNIDDLTIYEQEIQNLKQKLDVTQEEMQLKLNNNSKNAITTLQLLQSKLIQVEAASTQQDGQLIEIAQNYGNLHQLLQICISDNESNREEELSQQLKLHEAFTAAQSAAQKDTTIQQNWLKRSIGCKDIKQTLQSILQGDQCSDTDEDLQKSWKNIQQEMKYRIDFDSITNKIRDIEGYFNDNEEAVQKIEDIVQEIMQVKEEQIELNKMPEE